jgi:hypothetical protein
MITPSEQSAALVTAAHRYEQAVKDFGRNSRDALRAHKEYKAAESACDRSEVRAAWEALGWSWPR